MLVFLAALAALFSVSAAAGGNPDLSPLPPKVIYRVGQKKHLLEEARINGIPDDVWENNIMGRGTGFGLVPWRRGLYGGANLDSLEIYGTGYLGSRNGSAKIPWVMKITIKDECRQAAAVTDLATDDKYLKWLFENTAWLANNAALCLNLKTIDCRDLIIGTQPVSQGREENLCDDVMQKLIVETKAKVVRDTEWDASWYLRDRSCIEKLEADPATTLESLSEAKWDWASRGVHYFPNAGGGLATFAILLGALKDSDPAASPAVLAKLRAKTAASDIRLSNEAGDNVHWVKETGPTAIDAYSRCVEAGRVALFRELAVKFENELHEPAARTRPVQQAKISALTTVLQGVCR